MSNPSVIAPVGMALASTRRILFQQFDLVKWLAIGFTAWLAAFDSGLGGGFNFNVGRVDKEDLPPAVVDWVVAHLFIVIPFLIFLALVGLVFGLLALWVNCRGKFMFLDNVVWDRAEIIAPWKQFRVQGNSCFFFMVLFSVALVVVFFLGSGLCFLIGWPDISRSFFGWYALGALVTAVVFLICFLVTVLCARVFFDDFVIPIMVLHKCRVMEGWSMFFDLFRKQAGIFILYLLFRSALGIAVGLISVLACCLLCCTVLIPYVGTVILLPLHVFWRCYSLHFLGQFSEGFKLFNTAQEDYITLS